MQLCKQFELASIHQKPISKHKQSKHINDPLINKALALLQFIQSITFRVQNARPPSEFTNHNTGAPNARLTVSERDFT
jgi:hypothetical protein